MHFLTLRVRIASCMHVGGPQYRYRHVLAVGRAAGLMESNSANCSSARRIGLRCPFERAKRSGIGSSEKAMRGSAVWYIIFDRIPFCGIQQDRFLHTSSNVLMPPSTLVFGEARRWRHLRANISCLLLQSFFCSSYFCRATDL